jgi:GNAT superfamily N-acetyltransferase
MVEEVEIRRESSLSELASGLLQCYYDELDVRFPAGFDPGNDAAEQLHEFMAPSGTFLVAFIADEPRGCGALRRFDETTAEIKRMWVDPFVRGSGLGRKLLSVLEAAGLELGYQHLCLDTSSHLPEAVALYRGAGFDEVPDYNNNPDAAFWFRKDIA